MDVRDTALERVTEWWGPRGGIAQFHHPTGIGGRVAGWIMATRPSNVARSRNAVRLLGLRPDERVIEFGCGPGVAVAAAAERVTDGLVVGVDHSAVVIGQARRRNRRAVASGRVRLIRSPVEQLPVDVGFDGGYDAALAINTVGMWPDPPARLRDIGRLLRPGGRIAVVTQPRRPGATVHDTRAVADDTAVLLTAAGFEVARTELLDLEPPAAFVMGRLPGVPQPSVQPPSTAST